MNENDQGKPDIWPTAEECRNCKYLTASPVICDGCYQHHERVFEDWARDQARRTASGAELVVLTTGKEQP